MLAFALPSQIQSPAAIGVPSALVDCILVRHLEAGHYRLAADLPIVLEVNALLQSADNTASPQLECAQLVRETLSEHYGSLMTEGTPAAYYAWVLIDGELTLVCFTRIEFQVDFGPWGTVAVETQDRMRVP